MQYPVSWITSSEGNTLKPMVSFLCMKTVPSALIASAPIVSHAVMNHSHSATSYCNASRYVIVTLSNSNQSIKPIYCININPIIIFFIISGTWYWSDTSCMVLSSDLHHILDRHSLCSHCSRLPSANIRVSLLFAGGESSSLRLCILCISKIKHFFSVMPPKHERFLYKDYENTYRNKTELCESQGFLLNVLTVSTCLQALWGFRAITE